MKQILSDALYKINNLQDDNMIIITVEEFFVKIFTIHHEREKVLLEAYSCYSEETQLAKNNELRETKQIAKNDMEKLVVYRREEIYNIDRIYKRTEEESKRSTLIYKYNKAYNSDIRKAFKNIEAFRHDLCEKTKEKCIAEKQKLEASIDERKENIGRHEREEIKRIEDEYRNKINDSRIQHHIDIDNNLNECKKALEDFLNSAEVQSKIRKRKEYEVSFQEYQIPSEWPEEISIGNFQLDLNNIFSGDSTAIEILDSLIKTENSLISPQKTFEIPFCFKRIDGIALCVELSQNIEKEKQIMKSIIFEQVMNYPVGKMQITMLDPNGGNTFYEISKMGGDNHSELIDKGRWILKGDIENAIRRVFDRYDYLSRSYNSNFDYEREGYQTVFVVDFPVDLSHNSLLMLSKMIGQAHHFGINFVFFVNKEAFKQEHPMDEQNLINKIVSSCKSIVYNEKFQSWNYFLNSSVKLNFPVVDNSDVLSDIAIKLNEELETNGTKMKQINEKDIKIDYQNEDELNNWLSKDSTDRISVAIGVMGENQIVNLVLGMGGQDQRHHVLIEGPTGAGKSVLLHTIITSILKDYSPEEVELYLLDYKNGSEFYTYTRYELPAIRVLCVDSDLAFGYEVIKRLCDICEERTKQFHEATNELNRRIVDIEMYRKETKRKMPRIVLIIDEAMKLLGESGNAISKEILVCIDILTSQGRSRGVHVILSDPNMSISGTFLDQMTVRFAFNGSKHLLAGRRAEVGDNRIIMNDNGGAVGGERHFRVGFIENHEEILKQISKMEVISTTNCDSSFIMHTSIGENKKHPINMMIDNPMTYVLKNSTSEAMLFLGVSYSLAKNGRLNINMYNNMLIACSKKEMMNNILLHSVISILFFNLSIEGETNSKNYINIVDLGEDKLEEMENLCKMFSQTILRIALTSDESDDIREAKLKQANDMINDTYYELLKRKENEKSHGNDIFIIINNANRSQYLVEEAGQRNDEYYQNSDLSPTEKIKQLIREGKSKGIYVIAAQNEFTMEDNIFNKESYKLFSQIISSGMSIVDGNSVDITNAENEKSKDVAVFHRAMRDSVKFHPYGTPSLNWINSFYNSYILNQQAHNIELCDN